MPSIFVSDIAAVSPDRWGRDHFSTLAYVESRMVDNGGVYQLKIDPRMRTKRRNFRLLLEAYPGERTNAIASNYPTRLKNDVEEKDHDDWDCLFDMVAWGILTVEDWDTHQIFKLTPVGQDLAAALRVHKQSPNGTFSNFEIPLEVMEVISP